MATEIKVMNDGQFLNGKPVTVYRIVIDGISIKLPQEKFEELTQKLGDQIKDDYMKMIAVEKKYYQKLDRLKTLRDKILGLLYGEGFSEDDAWLIRKEFNEMDEKAINVLIEDYKYDLGLE